MEATLSGNKSEITVEERNIAVLAHASIVLTFLLAVPTSGLGTLLGVLIPFFMWLYYRDRSAYLAYHTLQATCYQATLLLLFLALGGVLGLILAVIWVVTFVLIMIVVGLVLVPVAAILTLLAGLVVAVLLLGGLAYGLVAAWEVYNYRNFRYRWIADWLEARLPA